MRGQETSDATHRALERYLDQQGTPWRPMPVSSQPTPDYRLTAEGSDVICEVKTLLCKAPVKPGGYDPSRPIARKIRKARRQLGGFDDLPKCVLLRSESFYNPLNATLVACAAFGPGYRQIRPSHSIIDGSPPLLRFSRKKELPKNLWHLANATLSPVANTKVSAVIILTDYVVGDCHLAVWQQLAARQDADEVIAPGESLRLYAAQAERLPRTIRFEGTVRAIVLENPHGSLFPEDLFRGPFDQRWKATGDFYGPVWIGSTLESLYGEGTPFHML
jgi:hypothetical protein